jgi:hypothetical protein
MEKPVGRRSHSTQKQPGRIGAIRRELEGAPCPHCGWHRYQLVIRSGSNGATSAVYARCSHCQRPRDLTEDLQRIFWI